jgi:hypothetical protein
MLRTLPVSAGLALAVSILCWGRAQAQPTTTASVPVVSSIGEAPAQWYGTAPPLRAPQATSTAPALAAGASVLLPGVGQHLLGSDRKWIYLAVEAIGWTAWASRRSAGADFRDRYRDFAWNRARIQSGPRVDADFHYYETLTKWLRSGAFDADPGVPGVQPEQDAATFNGSIWRLAAQIHLPGGTQTPPDDPQYVRALEYYEARAYGTELLWDWTGTGDAQATYAGLIEGSDRRFRQATNVLGALFANHLVSAIDALVTARGLRVPVEMRVIPMAAPTGTRWTAALRWSSR